MLKICAAILLSSLAFPIRRPLLPARRVDHHSSHKTTCTFRTVFSSIPAIKIVFGGPNKLNQLLAFKGVLILLKSFLHRTICEIVPVMTTAYWDGKEFIIIVFLIITKSKRIMQHSFSNRTSEYARQVQSVQDDCCMIRWAFYCSRMNV